MAQYKTSLVSYFDILGFRNIVATAADPEDVSETLQVLAELSDPSEGIREMFGNTFTNFSDLVLRTLRGRPFGPRLRKADGVS